MDSSEVVFYSVNLVSTRRGYNRLYYQYNMAHDIFVITSRLIRSRRIKDSGSESYLAVL